MEDCWIVKEMIETRCGEGGGGERKMRSKGVSQAQRKMKKDGSSA